MFRIGKCNRITPKNKNKNKNKNLRMNLVHNRNTKYLNFNKQDFLQMHGALSKLFIATKLYFTIRLLQQQYKIQPKTVYEKKPTVRSVVSRYLFKI